MPYLVRKISSRAKFQALEEVESIRDVEGDFVTKEFRTNNNCLSTYFIKSIDCLYDAILAIVLTADNLEKLDVVVIDESLCQESGVFHCQTLAGRDIPIKEIKSEHHDLKELTYGKFENVLNLYKKLVIIDNKNHSSNKEEKNIIRFSEPRIKEIIKEALANDRIEIERIHSDSIKSKVMKLQKPA
ncbi:hypothetical protein [Acetobacterium bakii]|uniref:Uncharacterized protein n=1 Tax=Acetobacterium bakii TaxID=52689 RepID=A0A0L6U1J6_9FIRM|nr:hypothetical protein [Acetobacterium bakii]KNZ41685.1 hypothetical protein AKG39_10880 [Acetobacterium bakii]